MGGEVSIFLGWRHLVKKDKMSGAVPDIPAVISQPCVPHSLRYVIISQRRPRRQDAGDSPARLTQKRGCFAEIYNVALSHLIRRHQGCFQ